MWQKYQKSKKAKQNISLAFFALGILVCLVFFGKSLGFFNSFFNSFSNNNIAPKQYMWDGISAINVAIAQIDPQSNDRTLAVSLLVLNPKEGQVNLLHISNLVYLELPKELGSWQIGNVYKLGQEEQPQNGANLVKLSLQKLTGLPVEGVILTKDEIKFEDQINQFRKNILTAIPFLSTIQTDFSPSEAVRLIWALSSIRQDKVVSLDFEKSNITESQLLPDSSRVLGVNIVRLDTFIRDNLADSGVSEENLSIGIFNGTNHPGMALEASRIVTNLGGNIIITSTTQNAQSKSYIFIKSDQKNVQNLTNSQTYKRLSQTFAPECLKKQCQNYDPRVSSSRAQINIILGEDYFDHWYKR